MKRKKKLIGQVLLDKGYITEEQLEKAMTKQKKEGMKLGEALINLGYIDEETFSEALAQQLGIRKIDFNKEQPDEKALRLLDEEFIREQELLPLHKEGDVLTVAMANPLNVFAIDEINHETGLEVETVICSKRQLKKIIDKIFGSSSKSMDEMLSDIESEQGDVSMEEMEDEAESEDLAEVHKMAEKAPIVKLVNSIILEGIEKRASDIHIEPRKDKVRVRYRIDGVLMKKGFLPPGTKLAVTSRIKIMAGLDIAERRVPQDGRITVKVKGRKVDMRCSTLPTIHGEKIVLRVIDPEAVVVELDNLGMLPGMKKEFVKLINSPNGIILTTGPTGCGKTSTLYAALREIKNIEDNIVTIEDPVEFPLPGLNQVQINSKAGLNYANGLRAFLRQDPDIMMVGEVRDLETSEIAVHAALTGHLVFSTLHTNDAPGVVIRLTNMGVEPYLVTSALKGVLAQRLVRKICPKCKEKIEPSKEVLENFDFSKIEEYEGDIQFYSGKGCVDCNGTGYMGRTGIFELFTLSDPVKDAILANKTEQEMKKIAFNTNCLTTLREDGIKKALRGITTLEEVLKVTQEQKEKV